MTHLILVSCVKRKSKQPAPAQELYISPLFRKMRRYAEDNSNHWAILSAKYGLVLPSTIIEPYEKTLNTMKIVDRREWAHDVLTTLASTYPNLKSVTFLAGQKYREFLQHELEKIGIKTHVPMEGMRLGSQLGWLSNQGL